MNSRSGQMLVEIIIAAVLIVFVALGITQALTLSIRAVSQTLPRVAATFLSQEVTEALRAIAKEDWYSISVLATSSSNLYYPSISGGKWVATAGSETVTLDSLTYTRSFYFDDVYRTTSSVTTGDITSSTGGYYDPSTVKATVAVTWTDKSGETQSFSQVSYYSRFLNTTYAQTDWSGGPIGEVSTTIATSTFTTSTSVDYASSTGDLKLEVQ